MTTIQRARRRVAAAVALAAAIPLSLTALPAAQAATPAPDRTSAVEAHRVDSVPTPKLGWYACYGYAQCATVKLPLDYDQPTGAKVQIALLRVKATDQAHKIGSLFVNPGGPGGSGTELAYAAPEIFGPGVLSRFDVVGFDPRGIAFSDNVKCFTNNGTQAAALAGMNVAFPFTKAEENAYVTSSRALGKACSTTGRPLSASMSTAEVARDMDVLRRAVGDKQLNYLGFSYGTYLGQVYANLFPDRVRSLVIDGVLDPIAWTGTAATASQPQTDRLHSADGAAKALHEILVRCDKAGGVRCAFAPGDPVKNYDLVAQRLKAHPLVINDPDFGQFRFTYADLVSNTLGALYSPDAGAIIAENLSQLIILTEPQASGAAAAAKRAAAAKAFSKSIVAAKARAARARFDFPYDNSLEVFASVLCTDGRNPADAASWPAAAAAADRRAKYFGRLWTWASSQCASKTWTAHDEDAYQGPFTRRTSSTVLIVGNYWDPATNYQSAVKVSSLLPNSRLLSSNSWGHTAFGTSACVTNAVEGYLLTRTLPKAGTVCVGDIQPFASSMGAALRTRAAAPGTTAPSATTPRQLPLVVPPLPTAPGRS